MLIYIVYQTFFKRHTCRMTRGGLMSNHKGIPKRTTLAAPTSYVALW